MKRFLTRHESMAWLLIFFLLSSTRLFESGLSLDPAIYATIARRFAANMDWFNLGAGKYFFAQFWEHPFFAFWAQGLIFKVVGANDFTARWLGVISGSMTGFHLFRWCSRLGSPLFARLTAALTALSIPFVGRMATLYLEIPLMWFAVASLDYQDIGYRSGSRRASLVAGIFLGLAFLTKGIAALPLLATIAICAIVWKKTRFWSDSNLWICSSLGIGIFGAFLVLQNHFGSYSFASHYLREGLFGKAIRPQVSWRLPVHFFGTFFLLHPLHCLLALAAPTIVFRKLKGKMFPAFYVGVAGLLLFGVANGILGKSHQHYFYPLFPFANMLAALTLLAILPKRWAEQDWTRCLFIFAICFQIVWNWLPFNYRRKPPSDYLELAPRFAALRAVGVNEVIGSEIADPLWSYPAMSLWYWQIDTRIGETLDNDAPEAWVVQRSGSESLTDESVLIARGYGRCYSGATFSLWIRDASALNECWTTSLTTKALK